MSGPCCDIDHLDLLLIVYLQDADHCSGVSTFPYISARLSRALTNDCRGQRRNVVLTPVHRFAGEARMNYCPSDFEAV